MSHPGFFRRLKEMCLELGVFWGNFDQIHEKDDHSSNETVSENKICSQQC